MANISEENEMTVGSAMIIGIFVIFPLLYFKVINFIWTGLVTWIIGTAILASILIEIEKKRK